MTSEVKMGVVHLQAKECQGWTGATRRQEEARENPFLSVFGRSVALSTPWPWMSSLKKPQESMSVGLGHPFCGLL